MSRFDEYFRMLYPREFLRNDRFLSMGHGNPCWCPSHPSGVRSGELPGEAVWTFPERPREALRDGSTPLGLPRRDDNQMSPIGSGRPRRLSPIYVPTRQSTPRLGPRHEIEEITRSVREALTPVSDHGPQSSLVPDETASAGSEPSAPPPSRDGYLTPRETSPPRPPYIGSSLSPPVSPPLSRLTLSEEEPAMEPGITTDQETASDAVSATETDPLLSFIHNGPASAYELSGQESSDPEVISFTPPSTNSADELSEQGHTPVQTFASDSGLVSSAPAPTDAVHELELEPVLLEYNTPMYEYAQLVTQRSSASGAVSPFEEVRFINLPVEMGDGDGSQPQEGVQSVRYVYSSEGEGEGLRGGADEEEWPVLGEGGSGGSREGVEGGEGGEGEEEEEWGEWGEYI